MKSIASTPHSTGSQEPHRDNVAGRNPITSEVIISKLSAIPNLVDKDITRTAPRGRDRRSPWGLHISGERPRRLRVNAVTSAPGFAVLNAGLRGSRV